jgi:tRNA (guanine-N7-)-methyltransferase
MKKLTNPMALHHRTAASSPVWSDVYDDLDRPLLIDVGCAKGRFLMRAATTDAERFEASLSTFGETRPKRHNLLGLEIYAPIVEEALRWTATNALRHRRDDAGDRDDDRDRDGDRTEGNDDETTRRTSSSGGNLHFVACNANVTLTNDWLGPVLANKLSYVTILFPDPWSRARHASRRVVTPAFVRTLAEVCKEGTRVYCCSDVKPLAIEMRATFLSAAEGCKYFVLDEASYAKHGEATERELEESCARADARKSFCRRDVRRARRASVRRAGKAKKRKRKRAGSTTCSRRTGTSGRTPRCETTRRRARKTNK